MEIKVKREEENIFGKRKYRFVWGIALIEFSFLFFIILKYGKDSSQIITKNLVLLFAYILSSYPLFNVLNKLTKVIENKIPKSLVAKAIEEWINKS